LLRKRSIRDAFRAANYNPAEVELLAGAVRARINTLAGLSGGGGR